MTCNWGRFTARALRWILRFRKFDRRKMALIIRTLVGSDDKPDKFKTKKTIYRIDGVRSHQGRIQEISAQRVQSYG